MHIGRRPRYEPHFNFVNPQILCHERRENSKKQRRHYMGMIEIRKQDYYVG